MNNIEQNFFNQIISNNLIAFDWDFDGGSQIYSYGKKLLKIKVKRFSGLAEFFHYQDSDATKNIEYFLFENSSKKSGFWFEKLKEEMSL